MSVFGRFKTKKGWPKLSANEKKKSKGPTGGALGPEKVYGSANSARRLLIKSRWKRPESGSIIASPNWNDEVG